MHFSELLKKFFEQQSIGFGERVHRTLWRGSPIRPCAVMGGRLAGRRSIASGLDGWYISRLGPHCDDVPERAARAAAQPARNLRASQRPRFDKLYILSLNALCPSFCARIRGWGRASGGSCRTRGIACLQKWLEHRRSASKDYRDDQRKLPVWDREISSRRRL